MATGDFLAADEEQELARLVAAGSVAARDRLALSHLPLLRAVVRSMGRRLEGSSLGVADAEGEGFLGLLRAAWAFRPGTGRFALPARREAANAIRRALRRDVGGDGRARTDRERRWPAAYAEQHIRERAGGPEPGGEVAEAVAALPDRERSAIRAAYWGDGRPSGATARRLRRRAEQALRDHLAG